MGSNLGESNLTNLIGEGCFLRALEGGRNLGVKGELGVK